MASSLGDEVKRRRQELGLTQAALAQRAGVAQQTIDAIENGLSQRPRRLPEIARALGADPEALLGLGSSRPPGAEVASAGLREASGSLREPGETLRAGAVIAAFAELPRDVPVLGTAAGGADSGGRQADFVFNGQTIDYVRRPPALAMTRSVFAIYVTGTSMWPRFDEGQPVYVSTARPPAIGDDVVIELHGDGEGQPGPGFIKRLVRRTATKLICEQFNPPARVEFAMSRVKNLYRIIPPTELLAT